jgi:hypothetical protein
LCNFGVVRPSIYVNGVVALIAVKLAAETAGFGMGDLAMNFTKKLILKPATHPAQTIILKCD